jgi:hypothetical protein
MKARRTLYLSVEAVVRNERLARRSHTSLSDLVEKQLMQIPEVPGAEEEFWAGPALKPLPKKHDPRSEYLSRKHSLA